MCTCNLLICLDKSFFNPLIYIRGLTIKLILFNYDIDPLLFLMLFYTYFLWTTFKFYMHITTYYFSLFFASSILVQFKIRNMKVYLFILCIKIGTTDLPAI
jgi:hypothetical protein